MRMLQCQQRSLGLALDWAGLMRLALTQYLIKLGACTQQAPLGISAAARPPRAASDRPRCASQCTLEEVNG